MLATGSIGEAGNLPGPDFLGQDDWLRLFSTVCIYGIGALGLNILTGLAGQVSLGHAFFMGLGAYTAAVLGADPGALWGLGLPMWIWLPGAGIVAALVGILVAPTAMRVRGLYLAIVTLGLVFIGEYLWRNLDFITGGSQSGRSHPPIEFSLWKEDPPLVSFTEDGSWFGVFNLSSEGKTYLFLLVLLIAFVLLAKNLQRTRVGRAFMSIRDRDIAAEVMGVNEFKYKTTAFAVSSFFAGICRSPAGESGGPHHPRDLEPLPVGRVHRHHPHRWGGHDHRHVAGDPLRDLVAAHRPGLHQLDAGCGRVPATASSPASSTSSSAPAPVTSV